MKTLNKKDVKILLLEYSNSSVSKKFRMKEKINKDGMRIQLNIENILPRPRDLDLL